MKLHIESIEGGTYLATIDDKQNRRLVKNADDSAKSFKCLKEIKTHFEQTEFEEVWLKQSTPYDEMCGLDTGQAKLEIKLDWR